MSSTRCTGHPAERTASTAAASPSSMPSTTARARFSGVALVRVSPCSEPVAVGRFGVRSPSR